MSNNNHILKLILIYNDNYDNAWLDKQISMIETYRHAHLQGSIKDIIGDYRYGKDHAIVALR